MNVIFFEASCRAATRAKLLLSIHTLLYAFIFLQAVAIIQHKDFFVTVTETTITNNTANCSYGTEGANNFFSTWAELAAAVGETRFDPLVCKGIQISYKIQPNTILEATETATTTTNPPSSSFPSITPPSSPLILSPTIITTTSPRPTTKIPCPSSSSSLPSSATSYSLSYHYDRLSSSSGSNTRGFTSTNNNRKTKKQSTTVDLNEIINDVAARIKQQSSTLLPTPMPTTTITTDIPSSNVLTFYNDDIISSTAITINPYEMMTFTNTTNNVDDSVGQQIVIKLIIQCGDEGNIDDNCVLAGGDSHFLIDLSSNSILPLFNNIQIAITFRGITMTGALDTSVLIYHSSGYISTSTTTANKNSSSIKVPTLHKLNIVFEDCYWLRNVGTYGAAINVYKEDEDISNDNDDKASATAATLQQLSVKIQRCGFDNNYSEEGGAILVENTDTTNSFIAISNSLFTNTSKSGAIQVTYSAIGSKYDTASNDSSHEHFTNGIYIAGSCFIENGNNVSPGTIYIEYPTSTSINIDNPPFVVAISNNHGVNNSAVVSTDSNNFAAKSTSFGSCSSVFLLTALVNGTRNDSVIAEECLEFDASSVIESCQLLNNSTNLYPPSPSPDKSNHFCPDDSSSTTIRGFSSWILLTKSIESSPGNEVFTLCPNTVFNPQEFLANNEDDSKVLPYTVIQISDKSNITIQCGYYSGTNSEQNNCTIRTGESHFWLQGVVKGIKFLGITFQQALETSILAYGGYGSDASFYGCSWDSNEGTYGAAINIWHELDDIKMEISLYDCVFVNNTSIASVIYNEGGSLIADKCDFTGNSDGAIRVGKGGMLALSNSCFEDNTFYYSTITVDEASVIDFNVGNFGANNVHLEDSTFNCTDINWESSGCLVFDAISCVQANPLPPPTKTISPAPSSSPKPTSNFCYSNWTFLRDAVESNNNNVQSTNNDNELYSYQICPNSVLILEDSDPELQVMQSNTHISCYNCTIMGGLVQVSIKMAPTNVQFRGITFSGAQRGSVLAFGRREASALFLNCTFDAGNGLSIVKIFYQFGPESMSLTLKQCTFSSNVANTALIQNQGGVLVITDCVINNNEVGNVVSVTGPGSLALTRTCFEENASVIYGTIKLSNGSTVIENSDNFGKNNSVAFSSSPCDIFVVSDNGCLPFEAMTCLASIYTL